MSAFFVRHWQFTLVLFAGLVLLGANALLTIPRAEDPSFPIPQFIVRTVLPGASPGDMEKLVSKPLEDALDALEDVREVRSVSQDGISIVTLEFTWDIDVDRKYDEVVREANAVRATLPEGITRFETEKANTARTNIVQLALIGPTLAPRELEDIALDLRDEIDRVPGVDETEVFGARRSQVRVAPDMGRLSQLGIPVTAIADVLRAENVDAPIGVLHAGDRRFNVKVTGAYSDLDEIRDTVVLSGEGRTVRVRDVAAVDWAYDEHRYRTRHNGEPAVFVAANQKAGGNVFAVRDGIHAVVDAFEQDLPDGVRIERGFDQSINVEHRLSGLVRDFGIALALVSLTLLPLGWRASLVVMISIPLSLAIGVALLQYFGFTLNQLSIAGFVLALGLLVDDSIVVTENIARHLRSGMERTAAAIEGARQIGVAVLGCTACLMLAFMPLLFLPEGAGAFIRSLPASVLATVAASLFVALTVIPFLASRLLSRHEHPEGNALLRGVMRGIHLLYRPLLRRALAAPRTTLVLALSAFALSLLLVPRLGFSLFPPSDVPQVLVDIEYPEGTALEQTDAALRMVERTLAASPEVEWTMANLGRGNPQIYYNVNPEQERTNHASVFVGLHTWDADTSPVVLDRWRAQFAAWPGAQFIVRVFENGPPIEAPIAVRISGDDMRTLQALAARVTETIEGVAGTRDVRNPLRLDRTDVNLGLDYDKAALLGVPAGALDRSVRIALGGEVVGQFRQADGESFDIDVRLPFDARQEFDVLDRVYVPVRDGASMPVSQLANLRLESEPARIDRFQRERTVTVTAHTASGYLTSKVTADVLQQLQALPLPPGYHIAAGGQAEAQARSFGGLANALLLALFAILAVLVLEFRSFSASTVVAGVIPLGIMGGLVMLWLVGESLSFTAVIGFIALVGIEIKNSILLVDFTQQLRAEGVPLRDAVERAGEIRFLPVLLTSATAIGGLTPLALENSGLYSPLAWVLIGGLISSTLLARLVTPATYLLLAPADEPGPDGQVTGSVPAAATVQGAAVAAPAGEGTVG